MHREMWESQKCCAGKKCALCGRGMSLDRLVCSAVLLATTGVIYTADILDRETTKSYWLTVYATDHGVVPLYTTIEVYIEVEDVNDNAPLTSEPIYYPYVKENSGKDVSVIQIQAQDPDSSTNEKLTYRITSGNPQNFFVIDTKTVEYHARADQICTSVPHLLNEVDKEIAPADVT
ncbi:Protocadherin Fat 3 [Willisornis vidua]|uniref:Protocadherin Fat 3 n=1 Tax=Willisornis vidua TaxID=1566151 RepID=A0ABQ9DDC5_9PASS|nr:Protocadherin Fat 3 [Willisornis vidua]